MTNDSMNSTARQQCEGIYEAQCANAEPEEAVSCALRSFFPVPPPRLSRQRGLIARRKNGIDRVARALARATCASRVTATHGNATRAPTPIFASHPSPSMPPPQVDYSLYLVTGRELLPPGVDYYDSLEKTLATGAVGVVQIREKDADNGEFLEIARRSLEICDRVSASETR